MFLCSALMTACTGAMPSARPGNDASAVGGGGGQVGGGMDAAAGGGGSGGDAGSGGTTGSGAVGGSGAAGSGGAGVGGGGAPDAGSGGGAGGAGGSGAGGSGAGGSTGCPVQLVGWAAVNASGVNGTTGGGNAAPTTVTTFADLKAAAQDSKPRVIIVSGTIKTTDGGGSAMDVASNKTIIGKDKNATIYGGVNMSSVSNVIIRNLNIQGTYP